MLKMMRITLLFVCLSVITGFLLDANTVPNEAGNNQFLTLSEFYEEKKQQLEKVENVHVETLQLRHDMDRMLAMLTSQVQQKFAILENRTVINAPSNATTKALDEINQKYKELQDNNTNLKNLYDDLLVKYLAQNQELTSVKGEIVVLQSLKNIQPLQDIHNIQQQLQSVSSQAHSLSVNEQARSQDFLALYNVTLNSKQEMNNRIQTMERDYNTTITKLRYQLEENQNISAASFEQKIKDLEIHYNGTLASVVRNLTISYEKVAVTSCVSSGHTTSSSEIIKFEDEKTEIGINQLSAFKTSGKFTCEKDGLYQVSVFIATFSNGAAYSIYKNGNRVSQIYANNDSSTYTHTGTGVVAVLLQVGDTVWVQTETTMYVYNTYSCITIVKIK